MQSFRAAPQMPESIESPLPPGGDELLAALFPFAVAGTEHARVFFAGLAAALHADPARVRGFLDNAYARQFALWQSVLETPRSLPAEPTTPAEPDARYRDPAWHELPWFAYLRRQHALWNEWATALPDILELPRDDRRRVAFALRQWVDAISPANTLGANPVALHRAFATEGRSVAMGAERLAKDLAKGAITMSDPDAYRVGVDLATTPGHVVHESPLVQLIRYAPAGSKVRGRPLLIIPPFINRYYILDLRPENSFVRHAVSEGYDVFMVSWRSAGPEQARAGWADYVREGVLDTLSVTLDLARTSRAALLGFCVGGTLATTAAALEAAQGRSRIASLTLLATLLDFRDPGDIGVYVNEAFVKQCELEFADGGVMPGQRLAAAFASLRARELVWHFVQHNYLLGETPPPFDLLHWNSDGANVPGRLYCEYLRAMYLENCLRSPGALRIEDVPIDLGTIDVPTYVLAAREDHIVPWRSAFASVALLPNVDRFVLAESGHVAGIVNPPTTQRRGYWTGPPDLSTADHWLAKAQHSAGSWWQDWVGWQQRHAGRWRAAPTEPDNARHRAIEPAPGRYVLERSAGPEMSGRPPSFI